MLRHHVAIVLAACVPLPYVHAQSSKSTHSYSPCQLSGTTVVETERLPERPSSRDVKTSKGQRTITMIDGYRILYLLDPDEPFINMKDETLERDTYQQQKADLVDDLAEMAKDATVEPEVKRATFGSVESYTITRNELSGGVLSVSEFFDSNKDSVLTIYYLNDEPERRHFKTLGEFVALRDHILNEVGACVSQRPQ